MNTFRDNQDYEADMFVNNHEAKEIMDDNTLLVVVDTNKPSITQCEDLLYMAKMIVVLDHHRQEAIRSATRCFPILSRMHHPRARWLPRFSSILLRESASGTWRRTASMPAS